MHKYRAFREWEKLNFKIPVPKGYIIFFSSFVYIHLYIRMVWEEFIKHRDKFASYVLSGEVHNQTDWQCDEYFLIFLSFALRSWCEIVHWWVGFTTLDMESQKTWKKFAFLFYFFYFFYFFFSSSHHLQAKHHYRLAALRLHPHAIARSLVLGTLGEEDRTSIARNLSGGGNLKVLLVVRRRRKKKQLQT